MLFDWRDARKPSQMSKICGSWEVLIKVHECRQIQPVSYQVFRGSSFRAVREICPSDTTLA